MSAGYASNYMYMFILVLADRQLRRCNFMKNMKPLH